MFSKNNLRNNSVKNLAQLHSCSISLLKVESIFLVGCKSIVKSFSSMALPMLPEQKEKTYLFYYNDLWEEENFYRKKYFLKIILALKKQRFTTVLSTSSSNYILDMYTIKRYITLIRSYLKNHFLVDVDWVNSRFLIFFYFLTKVKKSSFLSSYELISIKKKFILRNLFFVFIFSIYRLKFFFNVSSVNATLTSRYLFSKPAYKSYRNRFPRKLFLIYYSPYKVSYNYGSSLLLFRQRQNFLNRLHFINSYVSNIKPSSNNLHQNFKYSGLVLTKLNLKNKPGSLPLRYGRNILKYLQILNIRLKKLNHLLKSSRNLSFIRKNHIFRKSDELSTSHSKTFFQFVNKSKRGGSVILNKFHSNYNINYKKKFLSFSHLTSSTTMRKIYFFFLNFMLKLSNLLKSLLLRLKNYKSLIRGIKFSRQFLFLIRKIEKKAQYWRLNTKFLKNSTYFFFKVKNNFFYYFSRFFYFNSLFRKNFFNLSKIFYSDLKNSEELFKSHEFSFGRFYGLKVTKLFKSSEELQYKLLSIFRVYRRALQKIMIPVKDSYNLFSLKKQLQIQHFSSLSVFSGQLVSFKQNQKKGTFFTDLITYKTNSSIKVNNISGFFSKIYKIKQNFFLSKKGLINNSLFFIFSTSFLNKSFSQFEYFLPFLTLFRTPFYYNNFVQFLCEQNSKGAFYPYMLTLVFSNFLLILSKFKMISKITKNRSTHPFILTTFYLSFFYPLILNVPSFKTKIDNNNKLFEVLKLAKVIIADKLKLSNLSDLYLFFRKKGILKLILNPKVINSELKNFPYMYRTKVQKNIFDTENNAALQYDSKAFVLDFPRRFQTTFFKFRRYPFGQRKKRTRLIYRYLKRLLSKKVKRQYYYLKQSKNRGKTILQHNYIRRKYYHERLCGKNEYKKRFFKYKTKYSFPRFKSVYKQEVSPMSKNYELEKRENLENFFFELFRVNDQKKSLIRGNLELIKKKLKKPFAGLNKFSKNSKRNKKRVFFKTVENLKSSISSIKQKSNFSFFKKQLLIFSKILKNFIRNISMLNQKYYLLEFNKNDLPSPFKKFLVLAQNYLLFVNKFIRKKLRQSNLGIKKTGVYFILSIKNFKKILKEHFFKKRKDFLSDFKSQQHKKDFVTNVILLFNQLGKITAHLNFFLNKVSAQIAVRFYMLDFKKVSNIELLRLFSFIQNRIYTIKSVKRKRISRLLLNVYKLTKKFRESFFFNNFKKLGFNVKHFFKSQRASDLRQYRVSLIFAKQKLSGQERWRRSKVFFIHSMFYSRFMKESELKYFWRRYGGNAFRSLKFFDYQSLYLLEKKYKHNILSEFYPIFMFHPLLPTPSITPVIFRFSYLNSSYRFQTNLSSKISQTFLPSINFLDGLLDNSFISSFYISFVLPYQHKNFPESVSGLFQILLFNWLIFLKNFYFLKILKNIYSGLFITKLKEYLIILSFYLKRNKFLFSLNLYNFLSEMFYFEYFFNKLKFLFLSIIRLFIPFFFQHINNDKSQFGVIRLPFSSKKLFIYTKNNSKRILSSDSNQIQIYKNKFFFSSLVSKFFIKKPRLKKKIRAFSYFFRITAFENLRIYSSDLIRKFLLRNFLLKKTLYKKLTSINYLLKISLKFFIGISSTDRFEIFHFPFEKFFVSFPSFLGRLFFFDLLLPVKKKSYNFFVVPQKQSSSIELKKTHNLSSLGFFSFFYSSFMQRILRHRKFRLLKRLKLRAFKNFFIKDFFQKNVFKKKFYKKKFFLKKHFRRLFRLFNRLKFVSFNIRKKKKNLRNFLLSRLYFINSRFDKNLSFADKNLENYGNLKNKLYKRLLIYYFNSSLLGKNLKTVLISIVNCRNKISRRHFYFLIKFILSKLKLLCIRNIKTMRSTRNPNFIKTSVQLINLLVAPTRKSKNRNYKIENFKRLKTGYDKRKYPLKFNETQLYFKNKREKLINHKRFKLNFFTKFNKKSVLSMKVSKKKSRSNLKFLRTNLDSIFKVKQNFKLETKKLVNILKLAEKNFIKKNINVKKQGIVSKPILDKLKNSVSLVGDFAFNCEIDSSFDQKIRTISRRFFRDKVYKFRKNYSRLRDKYRKEQKFRKGLKFTPRFRNKLFALAIKKKFSLFFMRKFLQKKISLRKGLMGSSQKLVLQPFVFPKKILLSYSLGSLLSAYTKWLELKYFNNLNQRVSQIDNCVNLFYEKINFLSHGSLKLLKFSVFPYISKLLKIPSYPSPEILKRQLINIGFQKKRAMIVLYRQYKKMFKQFKDIKEKRIVILKFLKRLRLKIRKLNRQLPFLVNTLINKKAINLEYSRTKFLRDFRDKFAVNFSSSAFEIFSKNFFIKNNKNFVNNFFFSLFAKFILSKFRSSKFADKKNIIDRNRYSLTGFKNYLKFKPFNYFYKDLLVDKNYVFKNFKLRRFLNLLNLITKQMYTFSSVCIFVSEWRLIKQLNLYFLNNLYSCSYILSFNFSYLKKDAEFFKILLLLFDILKFKLNTSLFIGSNLNNTILHKYKGIEMLSLLNLLSYVKNLFFSIFSFAISFLLRQFPSFRSYDLMFFYILNFSGINSNSRILYKNFFHKIVQLRFVKDSRFVSLKNSMQDLPDLSFKLVIQYVFFYLLIRNNRAIVINNLKFIFDQLFDSNFFSHLYKNKFLFFNLYSDFLLSKYSKRIKEGIRKWNLYSNSIFFDNFNDKFLLLQSLKRLKQLIYFKYQNYEFFNRIFFFLFVLFSKDNKNQKLSDFFFYLLNDNYSQYFLRNTYNFEKLVLSSKSISKDILSVPEKGTESLITLGELSERYFSSNKNIKKLINQINRFYKKEKRFTLLSKVYNKPIIRKMKRQLFGYFQFSNNVILSHEWKSFFKVKKYFSINKISRQGLRKLRLFRRKLGLNVKKKKKRYKLRKSIKRSKKVSSLSILSKFHPIVRKKIFLDCVFSPKFFAFHSLEPKNLFLVNKSYFWLSKKFALFIRLTRFVRFLIGVLFLYKRQIKNKNILFFSYLVKLYTKAKQILRKYLKKVSYYILRNKRRFVNGELLKIGASFFLVKHLKFSFFYNLLSIKFLRFFILRSYFFSDYLKFRSRFVHRYLWFRLLSLNHVIKKPKIFIIVTNVRNNFFLTGIDLFGRILYKSSPGMVGYTGTDRMSKYAWHDTSVDFFGGLIEFCRYFFKRRLRRRQGYLTLYYRKIVSTRFTKVEKVLKGKKQKSNNYFVSSPIFLEKDFPKLAKKRKHNRARRKRKKKYLRGLRTKLRRFFIISKGASDFNLRMIIKGMRQYKKLGISRFFSGSIKFPMKSFSLCRIKKVRRI